MPYKDLNIRKNYFKLYYQNHEEQIKINTCIYAKTEKGKATQRKYYQSIKGKIAWNKYNQSEKGRIRDIKHDAKRKRNLQWIKLFDNPFADSELINWHHVTDIHVIAIPKDLHQLYNGNDSHRENVMEIIKQIYLGDIK